jgi:hypothetical protein
LINQAKREIRVSTKTLEIYERAQEKDFSWRSEKLRRHLIGTQSRKTKTRALYENLTQFQW